VDKKDHYIKRCIAISGDSLQIRNGQVFVNGQAAANPTHLQFAYNLESSGNSFNAKKLGDFGVNLKEMYKNEKGQVCAFLDLAQVEKVRALGLKVEREKRNSDPGNMFPNDARRFATWTVDDYGPVWVPKKDATVALDLASLPFYQRAIQVYEHNDLEVRNGKIFINGQEANSYTFKMDYFWMQGDNRHNSEDSRFWGYVPADHIVGKPLFIWFSTLNGNARDGINWNRIFKSASAM
jgi:signal peptidase I